MATTLRSTTTRFLSSLALSILTFLPVYAEQVDVWIGTGGGNASKGIYHCLLDADSGKLSDTTLVAEIERPGFLAMHPNLNCLYAVGTLNKIPSVVAYEIVSKGKQAKLKLMNSLPIGDGGAAHVSVDRTGNTLLTAQYSGGSTAAFSLRADGALGEQTLLRDHAAQPSGVVGNRQDASHAHWTGFSPDNRFAFVPDLGLDRVVVYRVNAKDASLDLHGYAMLPPGSGPRHMKFHPNSRWVYVLNELSLSVSFFQYAADVGELTLKQTVPTVSQAEKDSELFKSCSEIRVHPNGKFVYAANRGHDTITVFEVAKDGKLAEIQNEHVRGATPRNFNLDPSGKWLLAGGQDSHTLACFSVDPASGRITYNRSIISTPAPICVLFEHE